MTRRFDWPSQYAPPTWTELLRTLNVRLSQLVTFLRNPFFDTLTVTGGVTIGGITYTFPPADAEGFLHSDGAGGLSWEPVDDTEARRLREEQELATLEASMADLLAREPYSSHRQGFELR